MVVVVHSIIGGWWYSNRNSCISNSNNCNSSGGSSNSDNCDYSDNDTFFFVLFEVQANIVQHISDDVQVRVDDVSINGIDDRCM